MREKISTSTIIRTLCLLLALTNLTLETMGKKVLPIDNEQISQFVTLGATLVTAIVGFWKNNSFTQEAIIADGLMHEMKNADVTQTVTEDGDSDNG